MLSWLYERFLVRESKSSRELGELLEQYNEIAEPQPNWQERALSAESMVQQLQRERQELFTVNELNQHVESVLSRVRNSVDMNSAYHSGKKIATQPYLMDDDPV